MTHAMRARHAVHHGRHGGRHGLGCGPGGRRLRAFDRRRWLERLEEYQRDLEQETADVADLIRRLREEEPAGPADPPPASV